MRKKFLHIILISVMAGTMLVGCANENTSSDQPSENVSATTTEDSSQSVGGESTESVSEETSSNVTENVSTESEVAEDKSEETKEEFTESPTTETENVVEEVVEDDTEVKEEIVASGVLEDADIEWKIVGTTLYVSGDGAIPDFIGDPARAKRFPDTASELRDWQFYDEIVEKIVIEEGITKIGQSNFAFFRKVKEIVFADSVIEVGQRGCQGLGVETIDFNNITKLNNQSFSELDNIRVLTIPGTITNISRACFMECNNIIEIYIEEGVKTIGQYALDMSGNGNISIHLPTSITNIHDEALDLKMMVYVKAGSYAEQFVNKIAYRDSLTVIVE